VGKITLREPASGNLLSAVHRETVRSAPAIALRLRSRSAWPRPLQALRGNHRTPFRLFAELPRMKPSMKDLTEGSIVSHILHMCPAGFLPGMIMIML